MHLVDTSHDAAAVLVTALADHVPADLDVGTPAVVTHRAVLNDRCEHFSLDHVDHHGQLLEVAVRVVALSGGLAELTAWHRGREVERRIGPADADG